MHHVEFRSEALKSLKKMPRNVSNTILSKIEALAVDPYALNNHVTRLQGANLFRLRGGDWRVVYSIENDRIAIVIIRVAPRGSVYD